MAHKWQKDILYQQWLTSHAVMDTLYLDPTQALVRFQEAGLNFQHAI